MCTIQHVDLAFHSALLARLTVLFPPGGGDGLLGRFPSIHTQLLTQACRKGDRERGKIMAEGMRSNIQVVIAFVIFYG